VATNIGRGAGMLFLVYRLVRGRSGIRLTPAMCRVNLEVMRRLLRVSIGGVFQFLIATSSYLFLMRIVARYGSQAVAGITIGIRIFAFTFLPAWGLGNAAATLVGQNLGAGKPERAEESVWQAARYNVAFLVCVSIVFIVFGRSLAGIFTTDPVVLDAAADCLKIISYGYGFYAVGMILTQAFNGAGDTDTPTLINFACLWVLQLPLAYMLATAWSLGPLGVYVAIAVADSLVAVVAIWVFRRGTWKLRQI
jgi:putative MATE family efflux protein